MTKIIIYKNRSVPVFYPPEKLSYIDLLQKKLMEMEYNFDFRKKWKRIKSVEMIQDIAILQYSDGTKLYLAVC